MGGGDLNLKKSWHPHTLKNQKRVYEAEQADAAERRKMQELQREIEHERNFEELKRIGQSSGVLTADDKNRLEWMYKGGESTLNREDYLTGRAIDKHFEQQDKIERQKEVSLVGVSVPKNHVEHECIPFSIRAFRGAPSNEDQVDLQRKIMEDPLMMIQQKEMETRQKLLQNPVKLKEIHRLLQQDKKLKLSSSDKKKKKTKKSKKKRSHSNSDGSDLDSQLAKKYKKLLGDQAESSEPMNIDKFLNEKYAKLSSELDKIKKSKKKEKQSKSKNKKKNSRNSSSSSSSSSDSEGSKSAEKKRYSKEREKPEPPKYRSNRNDERRKQMTSFNRWNRRSRSRSPFRGDRSRDNNTRYNNSNNDRERFGYARHRFRSRSPSPRHNSGYRAIDRKRNAVLDRYRKRERNEQVNIRSRNRYNDRKRGQSRSLSPKRKSNRRHTRSRSRSRSHSKNSKKMTENKNKNVQKSPEKTKFESCESKESYKDLPERAPATVAKRPSKSKSKSSSDSDSGSSSDTSSGHGSDSEKKNVLKNYGLVTAGGEKIALNKNEALKMTTIPMPTKKATSSVLAVSWQPKKKLTEQEKEARLREMQQNADWHDEEQHLSRKRNEERARRETEQEKSVEFDRNYIHKEMHKALNNQDSVEARLKSNKNNIQRMSSSMHSHFAKK